MKKRSFITNSFEETRELGSKIASELTGGEVICLYGDLGSGKTTFMQGFAKGLGVTKNVISPTFIIMRTYTAAIKNKNIKTLYHLDLYRIQTEQEAIDLGLLDLMGDKETVVAIEWPEKIEGILPDTVYTISFEYLTDAVREITVVSP